MEIMSFPTDYQHYLSKWDLQISELSALKVATFKNREEILSQGQPFEYLMIVMSGKAKVCNYTANGKNLVLSYYISDGIIGDMEMMLGLESADTTIIALSEFKCILIPLAENEERLRKHIPFLNDLGKGLAEKLLKSSRNFLSASFYTAQQRLCKYILETQYKNFFSDNMTDVAATIGTSYRHLYRLLGDLTKEGILRKDEDGYWIEKPEELWEKTVI